MGKILVLILMLTVAVVVVWKKISVHSSCRGVDWRFVALRTRCTELLLCESILLKGYPAEFINKRNTVDDCPDEATPRYYGQQQPEQHTKEGFGEGDSLAIVSWMCGNLLGFIQLIVLWADSDNNIVPIADYPNPTHESKAGSRVLS